MDFQAKLRFCYQLSTPFNTFSKQKTITLKLQGKILLQTNFEILQNGLAPFPTTLPYIRKTNHFKRLSLEKKTLSSKNSECSATYQLFSIPSPSKKRLIILKLQVKKVLQTNVEILQNGLGPFPTIHQKPSYRKLFTEKEDFVQQNQ